MAFLSEEFEGGGKLYVGGLEAAELVVAGRLHVDFLVDCRGEAARKRDRNGDPHVLGTPPRGVQYCLHPATPLTSLPLDAPRLVRCLRPVLLPVKNGRSALYFCHNGRDRSGQTVTFVMGGCLLNWPAAMGHVWLRRRVARYSSLRGNRGAKSLNPKP